MDDFLYAVRSNDLTKTAELLRGGFFKKPADPNKPEYERGIDSTYVTPPLHIAIKKGHVEMVRLLLENGAYPNGIPEAGATPLHCAANQYFLGEHKEAIVKICKLLIDHGADLTVCNRGGYTFIDNCQAELLLRLGLPTTKKRQ